MPSQKEKEMLIEALTAVSLARAIATEVGAIADIIHKWNQSGYITEDEAIKALAIADDEATSEYNRGRDKVAKIKARLKEKELNSTPNTDSGGD